MIQMPRIKLTRCISTLIIISAIGLATFSLWSEIKRNYKYNREDDDDPLESKQKLIIKKDEVQIDPNKWSSSSLLKVDKSQSDWKFRIDTNDKSISSNQFWTKVPAKPWFMKDGYIRPNPHDKVYSSLAVWPEEDPDNDRIANQLMYLPPDYESITNRKKLKKIYLFYGRGGWTPRDLPMGQARFLRDNCPVNTCELSMDPRDMESADAIFFKDRYQKPSHRRHPKQIWIIYLLEAPSHTQSFKNLQHVFNWTATYRHDSDLVTPYEKYFSIPHLNQYHRNNISNLSEASKTSSSLNEQETKHERMITSDDMKGKSLGSHGDPAGGKTHADGVEKNVEEKKGEEMFQQRNKRSIQSGKLNRVGWFVSNCGAKNGRLEYAQELSHHIDVDIYGACGSKKCARTRAKQCFEKLNNEYKYYLAFENSNCRDYMTEKFFVNGLMNQVLPIVMGAAPEDYERNSPPKSFIHVDDFKSPADLAKYLHYLGTNDSLYESYHEWRDASTPNGGGEFINTFFWCRLCAMMHSPRAEKESHSYHDLHSWWSSSTSCNNHGNYWITKNRYNHQTKDLNFMKSTS